MRRHPRHRPERRRAVRVSWPGVRVRLERADVSPGDDALTFYLWGKRYRKDGVLGKRDEFHSLGLEYDMA